MHKMKKFKLCIKIFCLVFVLALGAFLIWVSDKHVIPIVMYHSIAEFEGDSADTISPQVFKRQVEFLDKYDYNVISLEELVKGINAGTAFPRNTVVLTFDDALANNYPNAYPLLKEKGFPATFFVPVNDIDNPGFLSSEQIKEMIAGGMKIGSHAMTGAYLPKKSLDEQRWEVTESKVNLESMFDVSVTTFAYPVGGFMNETKQMLKDAGYQAAVTTNRGFDPLNRDVFELNRIKLSDRDNNDFLIFWKLTGYYTSLKSRKNPY